MAIVKLARALGLSIIAERVETVSQKLLLRAAGCTDMQVYLFIKAVSAVEIDRLWAEPRKVILAA